MNQLARESRSEAPSSGQTFDPMHLMERTPVTDPERFPPGRHPYHIVTPRYVRTSAGIKARHLLCHSLHRAGQQAYVAVSPPWPGHGKTNPDLLTPRLAWAVLARHRASGVSPIVVYPEMVRGNPLGGRSLVRYLLNFPGLLVSGARPAPGSCGNRCSGYLHT